MYEEQQYEARCYNEVNTLTLRVTQAESAQKRAEKEVDELKEELGCVKAQSEKSLNEAEEKLKKSLEREVAVENAAIQKVDKALLAYRRDPMRARESVDLYISGALDYYKKVQASFPEQDWSQLATRAITEQLVAREHAVILEQIAKETE